MKKTTMVLAFVSIFSTSSMAQEVRFLDCTKSPEPAFCRQAQEQYRAQRPAFARKDYQAMRNTAYCMWTGCDNAVALNRSASCVIRREIVKTKRESDGSDDAHFANCVRAGL